MAKHLVVVAISLLIFVPAFADRLDQTFLRLEASHTPLNLIQRGSGVPIVLVHGIDDFDIFSRVWRAPLGRILTTDRPVYFFKWNSFEPLNVSRDRLLKALLPIIRSEEKIDLVGYSAGGAISMLVFEKLSVSQRAKINLHTVASPIYGYEAPKPNGFLRFFVGNANMDIGHGIRNRLTFRNEKCTQWINTNCSLDKHACIKGNTYPELGAGGNKDDFLCLERKLINDQSHISILDYVVAKILND